MERHDLWEKAAAFHGHVCGGLAIGFKASLLAMELLGISGASEDEEIVCVSENDACGVDAVQSILGCSIGKGNLILDLRGKQAFSFFERKNGNSMRLVLKELPQMAREERLRFMLDTPASELFEIMPVKNPLPEKAKIFESQKCGNCGERTAEPWLRVRGGRMLCLDCATDEKIDKIS